MPVTGIDTGLINTNGTFEVGLVSNLLGCQVVSTGSNLIQNVILYEAVQGVHTVGEVLKAMAGGIHIIGINLVIDGAGQVVETLEVTLLDALFRL